MYETATRKNIFQIPIASDWESRPIQAHVVPIWVKERQFYWLFFHLVFANLSAFPVEYPTVPQGTGRVRIMFHSSNTEEQVERLVNAICEWGQEMATIEESGVQGKGMEAMPSAARQVYSGLV